MSGSIRRVIGVVIAGVAFAGSAAGAHAQFVDFNTNGDLLGKFSINASAVGNRYTQVLSGGLANTGAVDMLNTLDSDHTTAVSNQFSYDFATIGHSVTVSSFIKRQDATQSQTPFAQLGILTDLTGRMDGGAATNSYSSIRLIPGSPLATNVAFQTESKVVNGNRERVTPGLSTSLTAGNWYRVEGTFKLVSATQLLIGMSLEDWGPTGAAFQSTALAFSPTLITISLPVGTSNPVTGDPSVWVGFRTFHEGGADLLDNFSVVPEPTTLALIGLAAAFVARHRSR